MLNVEWTETVAKLIMGFLFTDGVISAHNCCGIMFDCINEPSTYMICVTLNERHADAHAEST